MDVEAIAYTQAPLETISLAAGTCYGKHDISSKRVKSCYDSGHMSVFEHASVTLRISGISRACSHQLVRHRLASYSQQSQRYCKVDTSTHDWYVIPPQFKRDHPDEFRDHMEQCAAAYLGALGAGIRAEDARYLLPEATKTEITMTMNCRELFHFLDMRLDQHAQWEIRDLASAIRDEVYFINDQWAALIDMYMGVWHD
jgi:thymidylate synthase (FAD)